MAGRGGRLPGAGRRGRLAARAPGAGRGRRREAAPGRDSTGRRPAWRAFLVALGIGLHNLGEGLAIGSAYAVGSLALGAALVVGFALHNTTEGLAIVAPCAKERTRSGALALLGLLAGAPAILGAWVGASAFNPSLAAFMFGIGAGAIAQVIVQILPQVRDATAACSPAGVRRPAGRAVRHVRDRPAGERLMAVRPEISDAVQDYAKAIWSLARRSTEPVSTSALAERLEVSPASASAMVKRLESMGLATREPYHGVRLTPAGERVALEVLRHHRLLELYLAEALGMSWDRVHEEAEVLEHAISPELSELIAAKLGNPTHDPHGDPIPTAEGEIDEAPTRSLAELGPGDSGALHAGLGLGPGDAALPLGARHRARGRASRCRARAVRRAAHVCSANGREHALGGPARARQCAWSAWAAEPRRRNRRTRPAECLRLTFRRMALADDFQAVVDSLPPDWTHLELDLRIDDEDRYIEAATLLVAGQRDALLEARLALAPALGARVRPRGRRRDGARHAGAARRPGDHGELAVREARSGRVEVKQMWGRPESVRQEFRRRRAQ